MVRNEKDYPHGNTECQVQVLREMFLRRMLRKKEIDIRNVEIKIENE
jgi:hypothetical protein